MRLHIKFIHYQGLRKLNTTYAADLPKVNLSGGGGGEGGRECEAITYPNS